MPRTRHGMHTRRISDAQRRATEDAYLNGLRHQHMSPEDTRQCQRAIALARYGQRRKAYARFCALHHHNPENITVLFWLARTTPSLEEARRVVGTIERLEPHHPGLPELRTFVSTWQRKGAGKGHSELPLVIGLIVGATVIASLLLATLSPARPPVAPTDPPASYSTQTDTTDPSFTYPTPVSPSGGGYIVGCRDGTTSHAGGKRGACSHHGGEK